MRTRSATAKANAPPNAFAGDHRDRRHAQPRHFENIARNGFGLPALLGAEAGIGAGKVNEADDGPRKLLRDLHAAQRLAIALGVGHAEVALDALLDAAALAVADHHHFIVAQPRHAARHGFVVAKARSPWISLKSVKTRSMKSMG